MSWQQILTAASCAFLTMLTALDITLNLSGAVYSSVLVLILAVVGGIVIIVGRAASSEVSFLDPSRSIIGLPETEHPLSFSDIDSVILSNNHDDWQIKIRTKKERTFNLVVDYPLHLARKIAIHLADLMDVPLYHEKRQMRASKKEVNWDLPLTMPTGRFPLEYLFLAGVLAASVIIVLGIQLDSIFSPELAPKWMLLLAMAFPAGQSITGIQDHRGFNSALLLLTVLMVLVFAVAALAFFEPATVFLGLIPASVAGLLLINAYLERKKLLLWVVLAVVCVLPGLWLTLFSSYHFHTFNHLDPAVVESIEISRGDEIIKTVNSSSEIRGIFRALSNPDLQRSRMYQVSEPMKLRIERPAGRNYVVHVFQEGFGDRATASFRLFSEFAGIKLPLGQLYSDDMNHKLRTVSSLHGVWPPGY